MNIIAVTTQGQLDKALADGHTDLIVDAPDGAWLEIRHDGLVRLWDSSRAVLREVNINGAPIAESEAE